APRDAQRRPRARGDGRVGPAQAAALGAHVGDGAQIGPPARPLRGVGDEQRRLARHGGDGVHYAVEDAPAAQLDQALGTPAVAAGWGPPRGGGPPPPRPRPPAAPPTPAETTPPGPPRAPARPPPPSPRTLPTPRLRLGAPR